MITIKNSASIAITSLFLSVISLTFSEHSQAQETTNPFPWAYPTRMSADAPQVDPDDGLPHSMPGSDREYFFSDISQSNAADWHPDSHPQLPTIVANGSSSVGACAFCHLANGQGKPENAGLTGLPAEYIVQQLKDFAAGLRVTSDPTLITPANMLPISVNTTPEEMQIAADYFASVTQRKWITVMEAETVPQTYISAWLFVEKESGGTEPLGQRILEMPMDFERTEWRDDSSAFIAYVPVGSLARGEELVRTGDCALCHGEGLRGSGPIPGIAGRSPSYMTRQIYDFQTGARRGLWSPLMLPVVEHLTPDEVIDIIAYVSSLEP
jgi:cytochrome c553